LNKLEVHPLATLLPSLNEREQKELDDSINNIGLQEEITLYEGKILDGVHRNKACITVGVQPRYQNLQDGISAEDYVPAKNIHRRHLNLAQRVEFALKFQEKREEKIKNEKKIIEKLKQDNKTDVQIQNALIVRERKVLEGVAKSIGSKLEKVQQGIVIKKKAKSNPQIANAWQDALDGKVTIGAVYKKATHTDSKKKKRKNDNKIKKTDALHEVTEQKKILSYKYSISIQQNQLIRDKYDRLVKVLKKILIDDKKDSGVIENKYKQLIKKLEDLIDDINNPQKKNLFYPKPEDLRKAELKLD
jgi:hypothetical protein